MFLCTKIVIFVYVPELSYMLRSIKANKEPFSCVVFEWVLAIVHNLLQKQNHLKVDIYYGRLVHANKYLHVTIYIRDLCVLYAFIHVIYTLPCGL